MKIIGIERFTYTSKKTNKEIDACNLYCTYPIASNKGEGFAFAYSEKLKTKIFCTQDKIMHLSVGDEIEVLYNSYGQVQEIRVII